MKRARRRDAKSLALAEVYPVSRRIAHALAPEEGRKPAKLRGAPTNGPSRCAHGWSEKEAHPGDEAGHRRVPTLTRDNVELVTGTVGEITETGVVDKDGVEHPADVIIMATGFMAQMPLWPMHIVGTQGSLREAWAENNPRAHLGITVPHFPNLFIRPNTNGGHGGGAVFNSECQVRYTMQALREMIDPDLTTRGA